MTEQGGITCANCSRKQIAHHRATRQCKSKDGRRWLKSMFQAEGASPAAGPEANWERFTCKHCDQEIKMYGNRPMGVGWFHVYSHSHHCNTVAEPRTEGASPAAGPEPVLCYVDDETAYFTTQELSKQWGDDWDDAPYEHNAETPYAPHLGHDYKEGEPEPWRITSVKFEGPFNRPCDGFNNSPYSVQQINSGACAWLMTERWANKAIAIQAGTSLTEFKRKVKEAGGTVFVAEGDASPEEPCTCPPAATSGEARWSSDCPIHRLAGPAQQTLGGGGQTESQTRGSTTGAALPEVKGGAASEPAREEMREKAREWLKANKTAWERLPGLVDEVIELLAAFASREVEFYATDARVMRLAAAAAEQAAAQARKDAEQEQTRWQDAIYQLLRKHAIHPYGIDGGGCDSGDPLDVTLAEIGQLICQLEEPEAYK